MVIQDDMLPQFPVPRCNVCNEVLELPRKWTSLNGMGDQIIIDWASAELVRRTHEQFHFEDLISGVENALREDAHRRGR